MSDMSLALWICLMTFAIVLITWGILAQDRPQSRFTFVFAAVFGAVEIPWRRRRAADRGGSPKPRGDANIAIGQRPDDDEVQLEPAGVVTLERVDATTELAEVELRAERDPEAITAALPAPEEGTPKRAADAIADRSSFATEGTPASGSASTTSTSSAVAFASLASREHATVIDDGAPTSPADSTEPALDSELTWTAEISQQGVLDVSERLAALQALIAVGEPWCSAIIAKAAIEERHRELRLTALRAIGELAYVDGRSALETAMMSDDDEVRATAIEGYGRIGARDRVNAGIRDRSPSVAATAVYVALRGEVTEETARELLKRSRTKRRHADAIIDVLRSGKVIP